ncbi:MAG: NAD-dependent epimerase/dehydratase family protein, partial [Lentisphaerae bacterium]|nr:NAD-dependent epimerase/dehydratase family protein [Lentisphaerota bacterium]
MSQTQHVLIFGATGEIGSRIAHGCVAAGHRVVGVTRGTNTRHRVDLQGVEMVTGDKGDKAFVQKMAAEHAFDTVVDSVPTPAHVDLAFKAFGNQLTHYLMCSSTGTFVPLQAMPADETHPWETKTPVNFWPQCERDSFALSLHEEHGFPVSILRPTNIIGAGRVPLDTWGGRSLAYWRRLKAGE